MFMDDLISREELRKKVSAINEQIEKTENELKIISYNLSKGEQLEKLIEETFDGIEDIFSDVEITNMQLKKVIKHIVVQSDGTIDIYLRLFNDIGLDEEIILYANASGNGENADKSENKPSNSKNVRNNNIHT